jgi:hypothetical protein
LRRARKIFHDAIENRAGITNIALNGISLRLPFLEVNYPGGANDSTGHSNRASPCVEARGSLTCSTLLIKAFGLAAVIQNSNI